MTRFQGVLTVPLYKAGQVYSQVRQAKQMASQNRLTVVVAGRALRGGFSDAWNNFEAAREIIVASKSQVCANEPALESVQLEYQAGTQTTLDVLNAQSIVVSSRITQVSAEHDQVVAAYQILASIGGLTARDLMLPVEYYDAEENYRNVHDKCIGLHANEVQ
jgi:outer membrane protein